MREIEVKPKKDLLVRTPNKDPLPKGWSRVPYNTFWRRQINQGSVEWREVVKKEITGVKRVRPEYEDKKLKPGGKDK